MTTLPCFGGCENQNLKYSPPKPDICGNWIIDLDRTNWAEATPLLQFERQDGCLVIRSDGTFSFKKMPDFSDFMCAPNFIHSGTGKWWTDTNTEGIAYLCMDIDEMDGQPQTMATGVAYFFRADGTYFLNFIIIDPDTSEVLVLKKVEKK